MFILHSWKIQRFILATLCAGLLLVVVTPFTLLYAQDANAQVIAMSSTLRLRDQPTTLNSAVLTELAGGTSITVIGRTSNNQWLQVRTSDGITGWAAAGYIDLKVALSTIPVVGATAPSTGAAPVVPAPAQPQGEAQARVISMGATLRLRAEPTTSAGILAELSPNTALGVTGRSPAGEWLRVTAPDGQSGWVAAAYVTVYIDLATVEVVGGTLVTSGNTGGSTVSAGSATDMLSVYRRGQAKGNDPNVFSKVGDSISVAIEMYDPIGRGVYNLGEHGYLQAAIDHFWLRENSFTRVSLAAANGWTTSAVLNPRFSKPSLCYATESPLECEYRIARPSVALIMLGTNDVTFTSPDVYAYNINRIVEISLENGVIPVLSTIPVRLGQEGNVERFNGIIREIAAVRGLPLWDFYSASAGLPNSGLGGDGVHLASPPGGYADAANFTGENLQYGYVARNLGALQMLYAVLNNVIRAG